jgi:hypothetical protein
MLPSVLNLFSVLVKSRALLGHLQQQLLEVEVRVGGVGGAFDKC